MFLSKYKSDINTLIISNKYDELKILLKENDNLGSLDIYKSIVLAYKCNFMKIFNLLLDDPRVITKSNMSYSKIYNEPFIIYACRYNDINLIKIVLSYSKFDPRVNNYKSFLIASKNDSLSILELLINDYRVETKDCDNIIEIVSRIGYLKTLEFLLTNSKINPSNNKNAAIISASRYGQTQIVKLLIADPRVDPSDNYNDAFVFASYAGNTQIVKILLNDPRVDPSVDDNHAIKWASRRGNAQIVKLLLADNRVDPTAQNNYAIRMATEHQQNNVVKILLSDSRVNMYADSNYAINYALKHKNYDILELFILQMKMNGKQIENKPNKHTFRTSDKIRDAYYHILRKNKYKVIFSLFVLNQTGLIKDVIDIITNFSIKSLNLTKLKSIYY